MEGQPSDFLFLIIVYSYLSVSCCFELSVHAVVPNNADYMAVPLVEALRYKQKVAGSIPDGGHRDLLLP